MKYELMGAHIAASPDPMPSFETYSREEMPETRRHISLTKNGVERHFIVKSDAAATDAQAIAFLTTEVLEKESASYPN